MPDLEWFAESLLEHAPSEYLRERLRVLAVSRAHAPAFNDLAERGTEFGDVGLRWEPRAVERAEGEMSPSDRFALMDSALLLHQTAETVWHWFLASTVEAPEPWFSIPSTSPGKLQEQIETLRTGSPDHVAGLVAMAFLDSSGPPGSQRAERSTAEAEAIAGLRDLLFWFARHVGSADAYNAIKHGAVALTGRHSMSLEVDGKTIDWASGESLLVLRRNGRPDRGREPWKLEQRWYSLEVCLAGTAVGCALLDLLWGRTRLRARRRSVRAVAPDEVAGLTVDFLREMSEDHFSSATHRFHWVPE
jgi:hypothetical protein